MRSQFAHKLRNPSISAVPPPRTSSDYSNSLATIAASILYPSPIPSRSGLPIYILSAAAFPDAREVEYDALLPYVARQVARRRRIAERDELRGDLFRRRGRGWRDDGEEAQAGIRLVRSGVPRLVPGSEEKVAEAVHRAREGMGEVPGGDVLHYCEPEVQEEDISR